MSLLSTSQKAFELVSGNLEGSAIFTIQHNMAKNNNDVCFMNCNINMIAKRIIDSLNIIKKEVSKGARISFSIAIDSAKAASAISNDARNKALVGGVCPDHFISLDEMSNNEI